MVLRHRGCALTFWVGGRVIEAPAGSFVFGPRDIPHTFRVGYQPQARFLLVTEACRLRELHARNGAAGAGSHLATARSSPTDLAPLVAAAAEYGIEILGPPGIPAAEL